MKAYAQSLGVADKVIIPGAVPNPTAYYLSANLFVLSSGSEGFNDPIIRDVENLQTRRRGHGFAASGSRNTPRKRLPKVTPKIFLPPSKAAAPAMARLSTPPLA